MTWTSPGSPDTPRRLRRGTEKLAGMVGSTVLAGVTFRDAAGAVLTQEQFFGWVVEVGDGLVVVERDGVQAALPADEHAFSPAPPGTYRLAATGEEIVDPDWLTVWDVVAD